jgi:hypothetical protein
MELPNRYYYPNENEKLIAVIGDSFIEAFQVNVDDNYPYILNKKLADKCKVYAFGKSGCPLSPYLNMSRYINKYYVYWMNKMLDTICSINHVEFIDLTQFMEEDYKKNGIKFNSKIDGHWNEYGHKFVANVLYEYLKNNKQ